LPNRLGGRFCPPGRGGRRVVFAVHRGDHGMFGVIRDAVALELLLAREHLLAQSFKIDLQSPTNLYLL